MSDASYGAGPAYPPSAPNGPLASWGERVVAYLIDVAIIIVGYIVVAIVAFILGQIASGLGLLVLILGYLALVAAGFYFYYLNGATGQSPGKRLTGLKVISETTGTIIGGGLGIARGIVHVVDSAPCMIGYLFPLWDPKRQTFGDKIMKTVVVSGAPRQTFGPDLFK
jgi:uncharacterized RDD family membrane protein YckC